MHWSAFLAYRRVPADAQVVGDVYCISCTYNLRGLRANGVCPECGNVVADSLYVLVKPQIVAQALRSFANSYFTLLALGLGCVNGMAGWPLLVSVGVIAAGAFYRALHAGELRYRTQLGNSPALARRVRWLWVTSLIELTAVIAWIAIAIIILNAPWAQASNVDLFVATGWLCALFLNALAAGWFGLALASTLGYGWMVVEFRVQLVAVAVGAAASGMIYLLRFGSWAPQGGFLGPVLVGLILLIGFVLTWTALHHAANAAEQEFGRWDDMLDGGRFATPEE